MASGSKDNTVKLWSIESQKEVTTLHGYNSDIYSVTFSPNVEYFASRRNDNTAKLWNV